LYESILCHSKHTLLDDGLSDSPDNSDDDSQYDDDSDDDFDMPVGGDFDDRDPLNLAWKECELRNIKVVTQREAEKRDVDAGIAEVKAMNQVTLRKLMKHSLKDISAFQILEYWLNDFIAKVFTNTNESRVQHNQEPIALSVWREFLAFFVMCCGTSHMDVSLLVSSFIPSVVGMFSSKGEQNYGNIPLFQQLQNELVMWHEEAQGNVHGSHFQDIGSSANIVLKVDEYCTPMYDYCLRHVRLGLVIDDDKLNHYSSRMLLSNVKLHFLPSHRYV
jgi:hypothetical protein